MADTRNFDVHSLIITLTPNLIRNHADRWRTSQIMEKLIMWGKRDMCDNEWGK